MKIIICFYHDTFNVRNNGLISNSQRTDITNKNNIGENYLNINKVATVIESYTIP